MATKLENKKAKAKEQKHHQISNNDAELTFRKLINAQKRYMETQHDPNQVRANLELMRSNKAAKRAERKRLKAAAKSATEPLRRSPKRQGKLKDVYDVSREILRPYPKNIAPIYLGRIPTSEHPMSKKEYAKYINSPHWITFREYWRNHSKTRHECFVCFSSEYDLHHRTYKNIGNEDLIDVVPMCRLHHEAAHKAVKARQTDLANAHMYIRQRYVAGQPINLKVTKIENLTE